MRPSTLLKFLLSGKAGLLFATIFSATLAACGGGGGDPLPPFWIETDITATDLDGDGKNDVVTVASLHRGFGDQYGSLKVYQQLSGGTFNVNPYIVGSYLWRVEVSDIDRDGRKDIIVLDVIGGRSFAQDILYLLVQDSTVPGRFLAPRPIATGLATYDFTVNDLNGDGAPDVVIAGGPGGGEGAQLLMQDPAQNGTFLPLMTLSFPGHAQKVHSGDLNGDGLTDLAFYASMSSGITAPPSGHVVILYGQAGGGYAPAVTLAPQVGLNAELLRIGDVDGNGLMDLLVLLNPYSADYRAKLTVLMQTAPGSFSAIDSSLGGQRYTEGVVVSDLNGDNRPDIATLSSYPDRVQILVHTGGGAYGVSAVYETPVSMREIDAADIDGDGLKDLVLLGEDNRAFVMQQSGASPGTFLPAHAL